MSDDEEVPFATIGVERRGDYVAVMIGDEKGHAVAAISLRPENWYKLAQRGSMIAMRIEDGAE